MTGYCRQESPENPGAFSIILQAAGMEMVTKWRRETVVFHEYIALRIKRSDVLDQADRKLATDDRKLLEQDFLLQVVKRKAG